MRRLPLALGMTAIGFILLWVLFLAPGASSNVPSLSTTKGSLLHDPHGFLIILLDSLTYAGVLFIVASGFTLIFGLMRVVNMAHGAFFLLAAYIAAHFQKDFVGGSGGGGLGGGLVPTQVSTGNWVFPVLIGTVIVAVAGLVMQQVFLRWNQGQELRQALITIAIAIIIVDQLESPVGIGGDIAWPGKKGSFINLDGSWDLGIAGVHYNIFRLFMLFVAVAIGIGLWLWLQKTRIGMTIRAGVDDRAMVSALGINIQLVFAIAFLVGAALVGFGGGVGATQFGLQTHTTDAQWLVNSLIVVIIGGMGSLGGAAVGAILFGLVSNFAPVYLPTLTSASGTENCCTEYSAILTFALVVAILAVRPLGLFGRPA
jgi:branched-chain amino acid transport system permease protein